MAASRRKTALYLDEKLMQSAKPMAVASGKHDYEIIEEALRDYVTSRRREAGRRMLQLLDEIDGRQEREGLPALSDEEASGVAGQEHQAVRAGPGRQT